MAKLGKMKKFKKFKEFISVETIFVVILNFKVTHKRVYTQF